ncbi:MAG: hypothetical protein ACYDA8_19330, partial [Deferrisomatales bacterium]
GVAPADQLMSTGSRVRIDPCDVTVQTEVTGNSGETAQIKSAAVSFAKFVSVQVDSDGKPVLGLDGKPVVIFNVPAAQLPVTPTQVAAISSLIKIVITVDASGKLDLTKSVTTIGGTAIPMTVGQVVSTQPGGNTNTTGGTGGTGGT